MGTSGYLLLADIEAVQLCFLTMAFSAEDFQGYQSLVQLGILVGSESITTNHGASGHEQILGISADSWQVFKSQEVYQ